MRLCELTGHDDISSAVVSTLDFLKSDHKKISFKKFAALIKNHGYDIDYEYFAGLYDGNKMIKNLIDSFSGDEIIFSDDDRGAPVNKGENHVDDMAARAMKNR